MKKFITYLKQKPLLTILIFTFVIHATYLNNGFIWLDHNDIEQKFAVLPINQIFKAFTAPFGQTSFYRPLVTITNSIDYFLYHSWAPGLHITNLLIHAISVLAAIKFIPAFWKIDKRLLPFIAAFIGVHPLTILIVGSITHRQESLLLSFMLLSLYFWVKATTSNKLKDKILTTLFWGLALFTKETALFVLPLLIVVHEFGRKLEPKKIVRFFAPNLVMTLVYFYLRNKAVANVWKTPYPALTLEENIATRIGLLGKMMLELVTPLKPNFSDATEILHFGSPQVIITILVLLATLFYILKKGRASDTAKAVITTAIMIAPGLDIVPVPRISSPHYAYLGLPAIASLIVLLIGQQKKLFKKFSLILLAAWITLALVVSLFSGTQFKNDETFFSPEVKKDPNFAEGYYFLGNYYLKDGQYEKAAQNFEAAISDQSGFLVHKDKQSININLAASYLELNKLDEAQSLYEKIYPSVSENLKPYILFNRALIAQRKVDYDLVIKFLEGRDWNMPEAYLLLAQAYNQQKNTKKEIETLNKVLFLLGPDERNKFEEYIKSI